MRMILEVKAFLFESREKDKKFDGLSKLAVR